jgi:hypothetical protein
MPGTIGNKNAEKWTLEKSVKFMKEALKTLENNADIMFIGTLAVRQSSYKDIYTYLTNKFKDNNVIFSTKKKIDAIIEERLFKSALKNDINATVAIFGLKNNHGWKDKRETDLNIGGIEDVTPFTFYTPND